MDNLEMENQFAEDNTFYRLIDRLEDTVDGAKNAPFSNDKAAVSRNELNEIIEGMRLNLPREVKQAQRIVGQAHSIIDKANSNGQAIIMEANEKAAQMISEEQIYKQAKAEAEALIEDAQNKEYRQIWYHLHLVTEQLSLRLVLLTMQTRCFQILKLRLKTLLRALLITQKALRVT